jgi:opacity protein-like surface antigen
LAGALIVGLGLLIGTNTTLAADRPAAVVVPLPPFHGFYIGAGGGYAWGRLDTDTAAHLYADGGFWTVTAGGDVQRGAHVFGVFVDYDMLSDFDAAAAPFAWQVDNILTVAGRVGWVWAPTAMWYGLGGWSWIHGSSPSETSGWTLGAGLERLFHDNRWSLRLEYRYTDFDNATITGGTGDGGIQSVRAVVALRFGVPRRF